MENKLTSYFCTIKKKNWEKIRTLNIYFLNLHWENKMNKLNEGDELEFAVEDGDKGPSAVQLKKIN